MADRSLRGMSIGSKSMETDTNVEFAPRLETRYLCANGHTIVMPFSTEADVPMVWECRCGVEAILVDGAKPIDANAKPIRTHWDMLLERRSIDELKEILDERFALLRSGQFYSR